jgi:hypothetical protein
MSVAEIKAEMAKMPREEVLQLAAFATHLAHRQEPGYHAGLDAAFEAMERGDKVTSQEFRRMLAEQRKTGA